MKRFLEHGSHIYNFPFDISTFYFQFYKFINTKDYKTSKNWLNDKLAKKI